MPIVRPKPILKKVSAPTIDFGQMPKKFEENPVHNCSRTISEQSPVFTNGVGGGGGEYNMHWIGGQPRPSQDFQNIHPTQSYPSSLAAKAASSQPPSLSSVATSSSVGSKSSAPRSKVPTQKSRDASELRSSEVTKPPPEKLTITVNLVKPVPVPTATTAANANPRQPRNQKVVRKAL